MEQQSVCSEVTNDSGLPTDRHSTSSSPTFDHPGELQSFQIRYSTGLGLCVVGGTNRPDGPHVFIDDIIEGGDAHKVGLLISGYILHSDFYTFPVVKLRKNCLTIKAYFT